MAFRDLMLKAAQILRNIGISQPPRFPSTPEGLRAGMNAALGSAPRQRFTGPPNFDAILNAIRNQPRPGDGAYRLIPGAPPAAAIVWANLPENVRRNYRLLLAFCLMISAVYVAILLTEEGGGGLGGGGVGNDGPDGEGPDPGPDPGPGPGPDDESSSSSDDDD